MIGKVWETIIKREIERENRIKRKRRERDGKNDLSEELIKSK